MANEKRVTIVQMNACIEKETVMKLRKRFGIDEETGRKRSNSEILYMLCEDAAEGVKLNAAELNECRAYYAEQTRLRDIKRKFRKAGKKAPSARKYVKKNAEGGAASK